MRWPHYEHIFFDCDSTLTTVEGIDALAEVCGKGWRIGVLTRAAMDGDLDLEDVYEKRLRALKPTRLQIQAIRHVYKQNAVEDAAAVIATLQEFGHQVYIISGGLAEPVTEFGLYLGVPRQNIRAVNVEYDKLAGPWWLESDYARAAQRYLAYSEDALTISDGKAQIVRELLGGQRGRSLLVGDGYSDLLAGRAVNLFVGYGGVVERPRVQAEAPVYFHSRSLAPILAIASGPVIFRQRHRSPHQPVLDKASQLISTGAITFQNEALRDRFQKAFHAAHKAFYSRTD